MNYTFHQLQVFMEVVRQKSITKAAEELYMTQPALSIQMKNFQNQFEYPLTEVIGRQLYITEFGYLIAELAENVLKDADEIKYKTKEYGEKLAGKLRISSASTGKYVIPYFVSSFLEMHSGVDLILDVNNKLKAVESLKRNEIDFALVTVVPEDLDVQEQVLIENRLYMMANTEKPDPGLPYIFREEGSATRLAMDKYLKVGRQRKRIELTSNEAVKQAVIAGLGQSLISLIGTRNELINKELCIIPSPSLPIVTSWKLIWLSAKKLSPIANEFLQFIRDNKQRLIEERFEWYQKFEA